MMPFTKKTHYMTVSGVFEDKHLNINAWFSTFDTWLLEADEYPIEYEYDNGNSFWRICSNCELTIKAVAMCVEYAERMMQEATKKHNTRTTLGRNRSS